MERTKIEINIPSNMLAFLEFSGGKFGRTLEGALESAVEAECQSVLEVWPDDREAENIKKQFSL